MTGEMKERLFEKAYKAYKHMENFRRANDAFHVAYFNGKVSAYIDLIADLGLTAEYSEWLEPLDSWYAQYFAI